MTLTGHYRILLADDHEIVRRGLREIMTEAQHEIVGEATTGVEAVELARSLQPDLVVLDLTMPEMNGLEAARRISAVSPCSSIIIVTVHDSENLFHEVLEAGARGYVLKSDAGRDLLAAAKIVCEGGTFITPRIANSALQESSHRVVRDQTVLTAREREIVQLLGLGRTNHEIAAELSISVKTVETHRSRIMVKLNAHSLSDIVRFAIRQGLAGV